MRDPFRVDDVGIKTATSAHPQPQGSNESSIVVCNAIMFENRFSNMIYYYLLVCEWYSPIISVVFQRVGGEKNVIIVLPRSSTFSESFNGQIARQSDPGSKKSLERPSEGKTLGNID